ncbi:MAG: metal ABC transporter permease [Rhodocyclaceae bacterium]|jgi:zinc transport system permease protein|nr:metal ABC transporter permease [Rhodocyclaceae bacterium]
MSFWASLLQQGFLQNALAASLLVSLACGVVGSFVVLKRIAFLAGGIAHGVLAGMGLAWWFGWPPLAGAVGAALAFATLLWWLTLDVRRDVEVLIAALWSVGMAAGLVLIAKAPGQNPDLMSYLFGNVLMVGREQLGWMLALDAAILMTVAGLYPTLVATAFDEEFARLRGLPVEAARLLILVLVALTVVLLIQVAGLILVIALLTLPAALARQSRSVAAMMLQASAWAALATVAGLWAAYRLDWPAGPTMVLAIGALYLLKRIIKRPPRAS